MHNRFRQNIIKESTNKLRYAAGNFYINDKPTGAVVGQQPLVVVERPVQMTKLDQRSIYLGGCQ